MQDLCQQNHASCLITIDNTSPRARADNIHSSSTLVLVIILLKTVDRHGRSHYCHKCIVTGGDIKMADCRDIIWWVTSPFGAKNRYQEGRSSNVCYNGNKSTWLLCFMTAALLQTVLAVPIIDANHNATPTTKEGDTIELACIITALTPSDTIDYVKWTKSEMTGEMIYSIFDNVTIADPLNRYSVVEVVQSTLRIYTLMITDVQPQDGGLYACHVGYTSGDSNPSAKSKSIDILVVYFTPPPETSPSCQADSDVDALTIGASLSLNCSSEPGNPVVNITWSRLTPSGIAEEIPTVMETTTGTDLVVSLYILNITVDHDGDEFVCSITSGKFPDFSRSCTVGPLVVNDTPTIGPTTGHPTTSGEPPATTLSVTTEEPPATTLPVKTEELPALTVPVTTELPVTAVNVPSPWMNTTESHTTRSLEGTSPTPAMTVDVFMNTPTDSATTMDNELTSHVNASSYLTPEKSNITSLPSSSNVTLPSNATVSVSNSLDTTFPDLTSNLTDNYANTSQPTTTSSAKSNNQPSEGSTLSLGLITIIGISAASIIFILLVCNVVMLGCFFTRHKQDKTYSGNLRSRQSVQRENNRIRRLQTHPSIQEETEA